MMVQAVQFVTGLPLRESEGLVFVACVFTVLLMIVFFVAVLFGFGGPALFSWTQRRLKASQQEAK